YKEQDRKSQKPRYKTPQTGLEWRPVQRSTEPGNERTSLQAHDHASERRETVETETEEERRRRVKGKAHVTDEEGSPRPLVMIDEDDLLEDIVVPETQMVAVESESEQIEAIAQLGQKVISKDHTSNTRQNKESPDQNQSTLPQDGRIEQKTPRGLLKVHEKSGLKK
ncbi:unnamed protein product, partial [Brassica oleracea]